MKRIAVILLLFVAAIFATAEKRNDNVPPTQDQNMNAVRNPEPDGLYHCDTVQSNPRSAPLERLMGTIERELEKALLLINSERAIGNSHDPHWFRPTITRR